MAGDGEAIALARQRAAIAETDYGPEIRCLRVLGLPNPLAIALLMAMVEAKSVAVDLALELFTKLKRIGRYDPRILVGMAQRILADGADQERYSTSGAGGGT